MFNLKVSFQFFLVFCFLKVFGAEKKESFQYQGFERQYLIYIPENLEKDTSLLLFLHPAGGTIETAFENYGWREKADQEKFILVLPQALPLDPKLPMHSKANPYMWNSGCEAVIQNERNDVAYIETIVKKIIKEKNIDTEKIYVSGFANGASMAFRLGIELSQLFSRVGAVAGHLCLENPQPVRPISMMLITGMKDRFYPFEGGNALTFWRLKAEIKPAMDVLVKRWLKILGLGESQKTVQETAGIRTIQYGPEMNGLKVVFILVAKHGHEWPGGKRIFPKTVSGNSSECINATDVLWEFFQSID